MVDKGKTQPGEDHRVWVRDQAGISGDQEIINLPSPTVALGRWRRERVGARAVFPVGESLPPVKGNWRLM
jgi:hypothetical protein